MNIILLTITIILLIINIISFAATLLKGKYYLSMLNFAAATYFSLIIKILI